tara:strand:- start:450 stop:704 length:255 start_codon:yes stop_codon:yes gene_type:complete
MNVLAWACCSADVFMADDLCGFREYTAEVFDRVPGCVDHLVGWSLTWTQEKTDRSVLSIQFRGAIRSTSILPASTFEDLTILSD